METSIGDRISQLMSMRGITQSDLASRLQTSQPAVSQWLSGKKDPTRDNMQRIAQMLDGDIGWLEYGTGPEPIPDLDPPRAEYRTSTGWAFRREPADGARDYGNANLWTLNWDIDTLVREVGQNVTDVAVDQEAGTGIEFRVIRLAGRELESFLEAMDWSGRTELPGLRSHLVGAAESGQKLGKVLKSGLDDLGDPPTEMLLLRIDDWGTSGLEGPETGGTGNFAALCKNNLHSDKQGAGQVAGGSYGLGKAVLWRASRFATVLFRSDLNTPESVGEKVLRQARIIGRSDLSWHHVDEAGYAGPGWFGNIAVLDNGERTARSVWGNRALAKDLHLERGNESPFPDLAATGTSIMVVGFNDSSSEGTETIQTLAERLAAAALRNFWPAIDAGTLRVLVTAYNGDIQVSSVAVTGDEDPAFRPFLDAARAFRSGEAASGSEQTRPEPGQTSVYGIPLKIPKRRASEGPHEATEHEALLLLRPAAEPDNLTLEGHVAYFRGRRMVVRYDRFHVPGGVPYHAVVMCGEAAGSELENLRAEVFLRTAEPPEHNIWRVTPELKAEYLPGGGTSLSTFENEVRQTIRSHINAPVEQGTDGPSGLRELLRLAGAPPPSGGRPVINVDERRSLINEDGAWEVAGTIRVTDGNAWSVTPVLLFASESGRSTRVAWTIAVDAPAVINGQEVLIPAGTRTVKYRGVSDPKSHPVPATESVATVDLRYIRRQTEGVDQ